MKFLKRIGIFILLTIVIFAIYKREYLSQAVPVYMQYLEERSKWEATNTGTYLYFDVEDRIYVFIKNHKLVKVLRYGLPYQIKHMYDMNSTIIYSSLFWKGLKKYIAKNNFLIETKFDMIQLILWERLWDKTPFQKYPSETFTYKIGYDSRYHYPRIVIVNQKYRQEQISHYFYPYRKLLVLDFVMLPKGKEYTDRLLKNILKTFRLFYLKRTQGENKKKDNPKMMHEVGGDLIKSVILYETK